MSRSEAPNTIDGLGPNLRVLGVPNPRVPNPRAQNLCFALMLLSHDLCLLVGARIDRHGTSP